MKYLSPLICVGLLAGCAHQETPTKSATAAPSPTGSTPAPTPAAAVAPDAPNRVVPPVDPQVARRIDGALPSRAKATPKKPRLILVTGRTEGFVHDSIPTAFYAIKALGEKTGAYKVEIDNEMSAFTPQNLARFDAILFANTTRLKFANPAHRQALLDFVRKDGKGMVGIHAASDNFYEWEEGQALMGGIFHSHPWLSSDTVAIKLDEPEHPLNSAFQGHGFWIQEEMYQIVGPYSREKQRVLTSLDMDKKENDRPAKAIVRADKDLPVAWIKNEGKGRVFYDFPRPQSLDLLHAGSAPAIPRRYSVRPRRPRRSRRAIRHPQAHSQTRARAGNSTHPPRRSAAPQYSRREYTETGGADG